MRGGTQAQDGGDGMAPATTTDGAGLVAHLATNVPVVPSDASVPEVLAALAGRRFATTAAVAVCDDGRLVGLVRLEDLFAAARDATAAELVDRDAVVVAATIDREVAVQRAVHRGRDTLAVVDEAGRFLGLVPPSEVLAVLAAEHDEDLARLSGFTHDVAAARHASVESVGRRFRHRLPWLLLGLAGAVASADLVGSFKGQLERNVILAFFIPGIVYMADAVGRYPDRDPGRAWPVDRCRYPPGRRARAADRAAGRDHAGSGVPAGRPVAVGGAGRGPGGGVVPAGRLLDRDPDRHGAAVAAAPPRS
jgi:CBS domain-containing protein